MSELVAFLQQRLAEDEQMATDATRWPWDYYADGKVLGVGQNRVAERVPSWNGVHIARHDPARVLREVAAKRAILALHPKVAAGCYICSDDHYAVPHPCPTLRALAAVFSDHPDFQEQWR